MVASLKYLAACGIDNFLFFGLYTEGTVGVVQAGWEEDAARVRNFTPTPVTKAHRILRTMIQPRVGYTF